MTKERKRVPDFVGRLYTDEHVGPGGFAGTWVRRAEVDALLDEIESLTQERHQLRNELTAARLALGQLTNGYKFPAECCTIAREALAGNAVEPGAVPDVKCPCGVAYLRVEGGYVPVCDCAIKNATTVKSADQWTPEQMAAFQGRQAASLCQGCFRPVSACVCASMKSNPAPQTSGGYACMNCAGAGCSDCTPALRSNPPRLPCIYREGCKNYDHCLAAGHCHPL